jgi:hypothetical protein
VTSESVNYFDSAGNFIGTVDGLTRHNACVEPGDSGGSNLSTFDDTGHAMAEGVTTDIDIGDRISDRSGTM